MELKDQILCELEKNEYISGEALAEKLYVSRNGIWKAVNKLRKEGYEIEAVTNKGYCLKKEVNKISEGAIKKNLKKSFDFYILDEVDSTNNYAKELAIGGKDELIVISEMQNSGKGRLGRNFYSPKGNGLYMSLLCRPKINVEFAPLITSYTAVAVAQAIDKLSGRETQIKWVNDIFMNGKKICGILTEAGFDFEGGSIDYAIIGIGINVLGREFPDDIKNIATSIELESGLRLSRNELASEILNNLANMEKEIQEKIYLDLYRKKSNIIGKTVNVFYGLENYTAEVIDIDNNAALVVKTDEGIKRLNSGEVSIKL